MRNEIAEIYPATSLQQGFIYHTLRQSEDDAYRVQLVFDYYEELDIPKYMHAWDYCISQYPILRTAFNWEEEVIQIVYKQGQLAYEMHDISHLPDQQKRDIAIEKIQATDREQPFDLGKPTLLRLHIIKQSGNCYTVLVTQHHSITDGWSGPLLLTSLHGYYKLLKEGKQIQIKEDTAYLRTQEYIYRHKVTAQDYWKKLLSEVSAANEISAFLDQPIDTSNYLRIEEPAFSVLEINGPSYRVLKSFCQQEAITMHVMVQFIWHKMLQVYSSAAKTIVGTTVSGRDLPIEGIEQSVGLYINTLPLVVDWKNDHSIKEQLQDIQKRVTELNTHSFADLAKLQHGGQRMFHSLFVFENYPVAQGARETSTVRLRSAAEKVDYPLSIIAYEYHETLTIKLGYDAKYLTKNTADQHVKRLAHLVDQILKGPNSSHKKLTLLSISEFDQIIHHWNPPGKPYPQRKAIHELIQGQVEKTPDSIAVIYEQTQLTYRELNERSNQLARHIRDQYQQKTNQPLTPDTLIALHLESSLEMMIGMLAVLKAGSAYVPLDTDYPKERINYLLEDTGAELILSHRSLSENHSAKFPHQKVIYTDLSEGLYENEDKTDLPLHSQPTSLAYVIYTSGTTGKPKGVMIEHQALINLVHAQKNKLGISTGSIVLQYASSVFDASVWEIFSALAWGAKQVIVPKRIRKDAQAISAYIRDHQINVATIPPALLTVIPHEAYPSLHTLIVAGEPCQSALMDRWSQGRKLINAYGPTECTVCATMHEYHKGDLNTTIGKPIDHTNAYVLDQNLSPIPVGAIGELYIGGAGLARGYLNRSELTKTRFIPNPFAITNTNKVNGQARLYKTGDLVRWTSDGKLEFVGRNDQQVKVRGYRIELGEVEHAMMQLNGIKQSCVIANKKRQQLGNSQILVGYYVREESTPPLAPSAIKDELSRIIPDYMLPDTFVELDSFPLTISSKLDKRALPAPDFSVSKGQYVGPTTESQAMACQIWKEVLGLGQVGIKDNFFQIGGNSISAIQVSHRMSQAMETHIRVADLFRYKTIVTLLDQNLGQGQVEIPKTEKEQPALSFAQERLWFMEQYQQGNYAYHIPALFELDRDTDPAGIKYALQQVVSRHEVLRSIIVYHDERHYTQQVCEEPLSFEEQIISKNEDYTSIIKEDINSPFDLTTEYPIWVKFYQIDESDTRGSNRSQRVLLLIKFHHMASDAWSMKVFQQEVSAYYEAYRLEDLNFRLPELKIQYKDFAEWQRSYLTDEILEKQLAYWKGYLLDFQTLKLPTDHARPVTLNYRGATQTFVIDKKISQQLRILAQRYGVTMHNMLLSSLHILLSKYTGQQDIITGSVTANRHYRQTEELIGFLVNTQVNRTQLTNTQSYQELIHHMHQEQVQAQLYQDVSFEKLVDELGIERDSSRHPVFQVMFGVNSFGDQDTLETTQQGFLKPFVIENLYEVEKFDLSIFIDDSQDKLTGHVSYATALFNKDTITRFIDHYTFLLEQLSSTPQKPYSKIDLVLPGEYGKMIYDWNPMVKSYPKGRTIHQLFEEKANQTPDRIALIFEETSFTYQELNDRSNQLARHIRAQYRARKKQPLAADTLIAIYMDKSLEMVVGMLGVLKAGGAYLVFDTNYPQERMNYFLDDTQAELILCQKRLSENEGKHLPVEKVIYADLSEELYQEEDPTSLSIEGKSDNLAYVIYTSGTTGTPKGVMVNHEAICSLVFNDFIQVSPSDVFAFLSSPAFDASTFEIWTPLLNGCTLVIPENTLGLASDVTRFKAFIQQISILWLTKTLFESQYFLDNSLFSGLNYLIIGGEALNPKTVNELISSPTKPKHFLNGYGPTECTTFSSIYNLNRSISASNVPIGRPIKHRTAYVLDENLHPVPIGLPGELHIGGTGLARGYLNNPELTDARFIPNPFVTTEDKNNGYNIRLYKTGDWVRWLPDGNLEFIGRHDQQVKIRGYRVELGEVEHALMQLEGVTQSCVVALERNLQPGSSKTLVAYYVANDEMLTHATVVKELSNILPDYMVPDTLVPMDSFPLTINGKLDKQALPIPGFGAHPKHYVAPTTETAAAVCRIWEEVLGLQKVGVTDDFFQIGGNSILAIQVSHRMSKTLECETKVADLFRYKTISQLLHAILKRAKSDIPKTDHPEGVLSFAQERLWFIGQYRQGLDAYHIPALFELSEEADIDGIKYAIEQIIVRHEVLRSTISQSGDQRHAVQQVQNALLSFKTVKVSKEMDVRELIKEEVHHPFDLSQEYPIRVRFYQVPVGSSYLNGLPGTLLLINFHHIASDGWSMKVFQQEMFSYYEAFANGNLSYQLPALEIQYKDYAIWQRSYLTGEILEKQLNYWKNKLADYQTLDFPTDHARPSEMDYNGASQIFTLDEKISIQVRALAQQYGVTLHSLLLSSINILLSKLTGQLDILTGSVIANRHHRQTEGLIGFFVNTQANRTLLNESQSFGELVQQVHQEQIQAQLYQDLPFEKLVDALEVERDPSKHPIFQVVFGVMNFGNTGQASASTQKHLRLYPLEDLYSVEKFDLSIVIDDSGTALMGKVSYATALFHEDKIKQLTAHFRYLLDQLVQVPDRPYGQLSLLNEKAYRQVVYNWNQTTQDYPSGKTVHQLFEEQVERVPKQMALSFKQMQMTYSELNEKSNQLARYIREQYQLKTGHQLEPDTLIALYLDRSPEMVIGMLGVLKAGGAYVPIDPSYPQDRINYLLEETKTELTLSQRHLVQDDPISFSQKKIICIDLSEGFYETENKTNLPPHSKPHDLAYVIYTSGTTGRPKGVMIEHIGINNLVQSQIREFGLKHGDVAIQFASYAFDTAVSEIFTALTSGAQLAIVPHAIKQDAHSLSVYLKEYGVNVATLPPALLSAIPHEDYLDLKTLILAGESCPEELMIKWSRDRKLINAYGPTENTVCATMHTYEAGDLNTNIGSPIGNIKVYVLDHQLWPVPIGVKGELHIGGTGLARGYLNQPELTAERFIPNPLATASSHEVLAPRLYKTGDLVRWLPDGRLEFMGRNDDQVKVRGHRIELQEIEAVLSEHKAVSQTCVITKDALTGTHQNIVGYYVSQQQNSNTQDIAWWPSIAEYYVYDELLYSLMTTHEARNNRYRAAIRNHVKGKVVVDIGTGPDAILARICVEEGAKQVYAIEYLQDTYHKAKQTIQAHHLTDKIQLFHGDSLHISLPEKADVCVSELVGAIGGSEGAAIILNDARDRHVKPGGKFIPEESVTRIALVDVPESLIEHPILAEMPYRYTQKIFSDTGHLFDLRLCLKGVGYNHLVSTVDVFEHLDWAGSELTPIGETHAIHLKVTRSTVMYGCLVWMDLQIAPGLNVDILDDQHSWIPIFMPLFPNGIQVHIGDELQATVERRLCHNNLNFEYTIKGQLITASDTIEVEYTSVHIAGECGDNAFYKRFFAIYNDYESYGLDQIETFMKRKLPAYMVPDTMVRLDTFPLTINGKIDQRALPDPDFIDGENFVKPTTDLEIKLGQLYSEVLGIPGDQISTHQNFFKMGGNSILSIQLKGKLNQLEEFRHLSVADLFHSHSIQKLVRHAQKNERTEYNLQNTHLGSNDHEVAIIGISGAFSGVDNVEELWQVIANQQEGVRFYSLDECKALGMEEAVLGHPNYVPVEGKVKGIEQFDPFFWEVSPNEAKQLDPQIRKFVEHCWFALESAGYVQERSHHHIGVFAGNGGNSQYFYNHILHGEKAHQINLWEASASNSKDALATKTAYLLNLSGPANSINTACSTGLVSVVEACKNLTLGTCDMALAGGVSFSLPNQVGYIYQEGMILSKDGHCKTFDSEATGTTGGSGVGVILLKRLSDAIADQDPILGVVKGYATNNDGARKSTYTSPSVTGQSECIINAQKMAKINPDHIEYVECHGTATQLGDPIEVQGLREAFEFNLKGATRNYKTVLGSVKANLGHTDSAAGTVGLIKVLHMFRNHLIPGQVNFDAPNPELQLEASGFEVLKENREWLPKPDRQRLAGVSSFGIGGTNAHVIIGDYSGNHHQIDSFSAKKEQKTTAPYIIPLSAKSRTSLEKYKRALSAFLTNNMSTLNIQDVAYTLDQRREHFNYRSAYPVTGIAELISKLESDLSYAQAYTEIQAKIVFMFPGQGSQYFNMARKLYENEKYFRERIDQCTAIANRHLEVDLNEVLYPKGETSRYDINETRWAQITLFIIEYAMARYLEHLEVKADAYIGHSIGEFVAATLSGVFSLEDAIQLVIARGALMQAMPSGSMLAINASQEAINEIVKAHNCEFAAINSEQDIVASGNNQDIQTLKDALDELAIPTVLLNTSHSFHSKMMEPAAQEFVHAFKHIQLHAPLKTFVSNVTGEIATDEVTNPEYWCKQLRNTVQFTKGVKSLSNLFNHQVSFMEVGAGKGLSSFINKHKNAGRYQAIQTVQLLPSAKEAKRANDLDQDGSDQIAIKAKLWMHGIIAAPNASILFEGAKLQAALPCYQFDHEKYWLNPSKAIVTEASKEELINNFKSEIDKLSELSKNNVVALFEKLLGHERPATSNRTELQSIKVVEDDITPQQYQTAEILCEILGLDQISIHDDFFSIGGTSILAIELSNRMSKMLGFEVKVADVLREKTIDRILTADEQYVGLVQPYNNAHDPKLSNLIFIHPGNGGAEVYQNIAETLSVDYNCIGIDNYNIYYEHKITSLNKLAHYYLSEYEKKYELRDSINLFGWSLGGQIALEMAAILENKGYKNINIVLLDSLVPDETIDRLYTQEFYDNMRNNMESILAEQNYDQKYVDRILTAMSAERELGNSQISSHLHHAQVVLFRATQKDERLDFKQSDDLFNYCKELSANNVDLVCDKLEVINCDCHHGNILELKKEDITNYLFREPATS